MTEDQPFDPSSEEDSEVAYAVRYAISSYGADYPVDGLVKRIGRGDIYVPEFQRGFVWSNAQASRFVESMLLGLPVPGIFLFKEPDTQKLVVVDGQQRLRSLQYFYEGIIRGTEFALRGVCDDLANLTYRSLGEDDRRRLDDGILHATIFQQDDPRDDRSSIYLIFERLNTGGTPLSPQEIRSCVYRGSFNDLLKELVENQAWREIYGTASGRAKDQELVLRFLALYENAEAYSRPMKTFLNDFMGRHRHAPRERLAQLQKVFEETVAVAATKVGRAAFRPERALNAAVMDALLVGIGRRLGKGPIVNHGAAQAAAESLRANQDFLASTVRSTTDEASVSRRLALATEAFAEVE